MHVLGIDTGGTFTDAVIATASGDVVASAKAPTRHHDLLSGIEASIGAVLAGAEGVTPGGIAMVSLSTTLATNAIVEGLGDPAALVLAGGDGELIRRGGLWDALAGEPWLHIAGGHDAAGAPRSELDLAALDRWLDGPAAGRRAFAVCSEFAVVNPAHEIALRERLRQRTGAAVTCSHELSSALNAPARALTALLNARLLPRITRLMDAVESVVHRLGIRARLMVVKGDGSLIDVSVARERPVETLLSGPAASVVGASRMSGQRDLVVADIGGTTTDIAVLRDGRPRLDPLGATVGEVRTLVRAAAVHSIGLGGDSAVAISNDGDVLLGPRRILPLCRVLEGRADLLESFTTQALRDDPQPLDLTVVWPAPQARAGMRKLRRDEGALFDALDTEPTVASRIAPDRYRASLLERLIAAGAVSVAGLTPTDAAHAAGWHRQWNTQGAEVLLQGWRRMLARRFPSRWCSETDVAAAVLNAMASRLALAVLRTARAAAPGCLQDDAFDAAEALLLQALESAGTGQDDGGAVEISPRLRLPLVAVGASAGCHFPAVARLLDTSLEVPDGAGVANALGAVVGVVIQDSEIRVSAPGPGSFRVHAPEGSRDLADLDAALGLALELARAQATTLARRAGAEHVQLEEEVEQVAPDLAGGESVFLGARIRVTARGRPAATGD